MKTRTRGNGICLYCGTKLNNYRAFCDHYCKKEYNDNMQDEGKEKVRMS